MCLVDSHEQTWTRNKISLLKNPLAEDELAKPVEHTNWDKLSWNEQTCCVIYDGRCSVDKAKNGLRLASVLSLAQYYFWGVKWCQQREKTKNRRQQHKVKIGSKFAPISPL